MSEREIERENAPVSLSLCLFGCACHTHMHTHNDEDRFPRAALTDPWTAARFPRRKLWRPLASLSRCSCGRRKRTSHAGRLLLAMGWRAAFGQTHAVITACLTLIIAVQHHALVYDSSVASAASTRAPGAVVRITTTSSSTPSSTSSSSTPSSTPSISTAAVAAAEEEGSAWPRTRRP